VDPFLPITHLTPKRSERGTKMLGSLVKRERRPLWGWLSCLLLVAIGASMFMGIRARSAATAEAAEDALLEDGEPNREHPAFKAKVARDLLETYELRRQRLRSISASEAQKAEVFNHLYSFFSRYYEAGDFVPRFRYGAREAYAVPYNGEETLFYWANKNQHYVKTREAFRDYAFTVEGLGGPYKVRFAGVDPSDRVEKHPRGGP